MVLMQEGTEDVEVTVEGMPAVWPNGGQVGGDMEVFMLYASVVR